MCCGEPYGATFTKPLSGDTVDSPLIHLGCQLFDLHIYSPKCISKVDAHLCLLTTWYTTFATPLRWFSIMPIRFLFTKLAVPEMLPPLIQKRIIMAFEHRTSDKSSRFCFTSTTAFFFAFLGPPLCMFYINVLPPVSCDYFTLVSFVDGGHINMIKLCIFVILIKGHLQIH